MSTINAVTVPKTVTFGKAFTVTILYDSTGPTRVDVTPVGQFSVSPPDFSVILAATTASQDLTLTDDESPSQSRSVVLQFTLGAVQYTVSTTASP